MTNYPPPFSSFASRALQAPTHLLPEPRYAEAWHRWSEHEVRAVVQAWASGRPLLVRGEAGCGKSQIARALSILLEVPLEAEVIHPRFEATDLKYREDAVRRLAHAQVLGAMSRALNGLTDMQGWLKSELDPARFITRGAIWRAMTAPAPFDGSQPQASDWPRAVLLIDEVDKADADVPHALLDVLGNRSFDVPATGETVHCDAHWPLIVITTNEDRELPAPFVRRCAVLNLKPPADDAQGGATFVQWLIDRARAHDRLASLDGDDDGGNVIRLAAEQTLADRLAATAAGLPTVGLAECLDLLYSLARLSEGDRDRAQAMLKELSAFALLKHQEQDQQRGAAVP